MRIRDEVFYVALKHYNGDGESAEHWMAMPNLLLGGACPDEVIKTGGGDRILKYLVEYPQKKVVK